MTYLRTTLLALAAVSIGCGPNAEGEGGGVNGGADGSTTAPGSDANEAAGCTKMDFVFVIDDSGSMREEQANLIANFPGFARVIDDFTTRTGEPLDYRIAITTAGRDVDYTIHIELMGFPPLDQPFSEPGMNGEFVQSCGMSRRWLERGDANLGDTFSCAANIGTSGPGAEMPLLGLEWSLNRRVADGTNAGFLRDDALLAIVMITDQDDCSREDDGFIIDGNSDSCFEPADPGIIPLDTYLGFLDTLKGSRQRWASAVIAGPGPGSCESSFGFAAEAVRMKDFVARAGSNSVMSSICDGDLTTALAEAVAKFENACDQFPPID